MKIKCGMCNGTGQDARWEQLKKEDVWQIDDCGNCRGKGKQEIQIVDNRKITKNKSMIVPAIA